MTAHPARIGADVKIVEIPVADLTAEAFAPYGEVSKARSSFRLDFSGQEPSITEVRIEPQPLHIDFLCRHVRTTQTYVPLRGGASVIVVAPPSDNDDPSALPDISRVMAFRLNGDKAINLFKGTWHRAPVPTGPEAHFIVLDREGTLDDMDLVDLRLNLNAALEIRL